MKVNLARNWFGPDATFYYERNNPNEIPDDYRDQLPEDAKIIGEDKPVKAKKTDEV